MTTLRIEDLSSFEDIEKYQVKTDNPLYYKALNYKRYDVIIELAHFPDSYIVKDFVKALSVGSIDLLTNRYYHTVLWKEVVNRLKEFGIDPYGINKMKRRIIHDLNLPIPFNGNCYACCRLCKDCEIYKHCGKCDVAGSSYDKLGKAKDKTTAIKYAREIRDAW